MSSLPAGDERTSVYYFRSADLTKGLTPEHQLSLLLAKSRELEAKASQVRDLWRQADRECGLAGAELTKALRKLAREEQASDTDGSLAISRPTMVRVWRQVITTMFRRIEFLKGSIRTVAHEGGGPQNLFRFLDTLNSSYLACNKTFASSTKPVKGTKNWRQYKFSKAGRLYYRRRPEASTHRTAVLISTKLKQDRGDIGRLQRNDL